MKKNEKKRPKRRRRYLGRHLMLLGALALMIWAGYELWVRLDDFRAWTSGVRYMSAAKQESFIDNLMLILKAPEMRELKRKMMFLAGCELFSVAAICLRNAPRADVVVFVLDAGLIACGRMLGMFDFRIGMMTQTLKIIPLLVILVACVMNFVQYCARKRRRKRKLEKKKHPGFEPPADRRAA